jgi:hypothetical protein
MPRKNKKDQVKARIKIVNENRGDWDFEDEDYLREDWAREVKNADTQLGYFDWVIHNLEETL